MELKKRKWIDVGNGNALGGRRRAISRVVRVKEAQVG